MKIDFKNEVLLTLRVSKGTDSRPAVKKVSDKLTVIRAYLNTGKDMDGNYNPAINFEVQIYSQTSKNPTENLLPAELTENDYITVAGNLSSHQRTVGDSKYTDYLICADKVMLAERIDEDDAPDNSAYEAASAW